MIEQLAAQIRYAFQRQRSVRLPAMSGKDFGDVMFILTE